jgi:hypothetical protein
LRQTTGLLRQPLPQRIAQAKQLIFTGGNKGNEESDIQESQGPPASVVANYSILLPFVSFVNFC